MNNAAKILQKKGILIYMVCSFFYEETKAIKKKHNPVIKLDKMIKKLKNKII